MVKHFKLIIEYDGTHYHGWQRQSRGLTIQGEIEKALRTMTGVQVDLIGSGRTDAGVHAWGQAANFCCETKLTALDFHKGLNSLLPKDVVIKDCVDTDPFFHARKGAKGKTYQYHIVNQPLRPALYGRYVWHIKQPLQVSPMSRALDHIVGTHDFKAFEGAGSPRSDTVRSVSAALIFQKKKKNLVVVQITGNGFLRFMVRNIVGTLVDVGLGKITPDDFKRIRDSRDRNQAGITAPPQGLFLVSVRYDDDDDVWAAP